MRIIDIMNDCVSVKGTKPSKFTARFSDGRECLVRHDGSWNGLVRSVITFLYSENSEKLISLTNDHKCRYQILACDPGQLREGAQRNGRYKKLQVAEPLYVDNNQSADDCVKSILPYLEDYDITRATILLG